MGVQITFQKSPPLEISDQSLPLLVKDSAQRILYARYFCGVDAVRCIVLHDPTKKYGFGDEIALYPRELSRYTGAVVLSSE